ncbi:hypothetical protein L1887_31601 [Cichorium endivia]|nr:hypothetical protein L1887_31601 [Cichorium endivia]
MSGAKRGFSDVNLDGSGKRDLNAGSEADLGFTHFKNHTEYQTKESHTISDKRITFLNTLLGPDGRNIRQKVTSIEEEPEAMNTPGPDRRLEGIIVHIIKALASLWKKTNGRTGGGLWNVEMQRRTNNTIG